VINIKRAVEILDGQKIPAGKTSAARDASVAALKATVYRTGDCL
jgi:hypothetical protein